MILLFFNFFISIYTYLLVETFDNNIFLFKGEQLLYQSNLIEILLSYKKESRLAYPQSLKEKCRTIQKLDVYNFNISEQNKNFIDSVYINNGELKSDKYDMFYSINELLRKNIIKDNIQISSKKYIFGHMIHIDNMDLQIPIIAVEIALTDLKNGYSKKIPIANINSNSCIRSTVDPQKYTPHLKYSNIRSVTKLLDHKNMIYFGLINMTEVRSGYKKYLIIFLLIIFLILSIRNLRDRQYKDQRLIFNNDLYYIYKGICDQRTVFIKRYKKKNNFLLNELLFLRTNHNFMIRYLYPYNNFYTTDLIFSHMSIDLETYRKTNVLSKKFFNDLKNTVFSMHSKKIVHCNLSPRNIFICGDKIFFSNFEHAFMDGMIRNDWTCTGSKGWRTREQIHNTVHNSDFEIIKNIDLVVLSMIIYYCTYECHPHDIKSIPHFDADEVDRNISNKKHYLRFKKDISLHDIVANSTINSINNCYSTARYNLHPFFWSNIKIFSYIANISDIIENKSDKTLKIFFGLQKYKHKVFLNNWGNYLDEFIYERLREQKIYNFFSLKSLLRVIRNTGRHYKETSDEEKMVYNNFPNGLIDYFTTRFPYLLTTVYYICIPLNDEELLRGFYPSDIYFKK